MGGRYWAVGLNFDYTVIYLPTGKEPNAMNWASIYGPYQSLARAKREARRLIKSDREHLAGELSHINSLKADQVKNDSA